MSRHGVLKRYGLILEIVRQCHFPNFESIRSFLHSKSFEVSPRTIQRDIEQLRDEFRLEIVFDHTQGGYYLDEENSLDLDMFLRLLNAVNSVEIVSECLQPGKKNRISLPSILWKALEDQITWGSWSLPSEIIGKSLFPIRVSQMTKLGKWLFSPTS